MTEGGIGCDLCETYVMLLREVLGGLDHLEREQLVTAVLKTSNDIGDEPALDT